ncbi:MAG: Usg family protein [bacterium]|nr:Usg family protein [bacterium]
MNGIAQRVAGFHLTTAEILYHRPDCPVLLQSFIWQQDDLPPRFPILNKFLHFWRSELDGRLHSVWVATTGILTPTELRYQRGEFTLQ